MPAPVSSAKVERSRTRDRIAFRASAMAVASPPMPPPTMMASRRGAGICMLGGSRRRRPRRCGHHENAAWRVALGGFEGWIVAEQRRTIRADELRLVPHIEIDMGVVEWRGGPHALELLDADRDAVDALVVHEMRHKRLSHGKRSMFPQ